MKNRLSTSPHKMILAACALSLALVAGCEKGPAEEMGDNIDNAVDEAADAVDEAADDVGDAIND